MITEQIDALLQEVANLTASSADEVEQLRIKYLSRKGILNALMAEFRNVAPEEKKAVGMRLNELKQAALTKINGLRDELSVGQSGFDGAVDIAEGAAVAQEGGYGHLVCGVDDAGGIASALEGIVG